MSEIEQILREAIEEKRQCIRQIQDLLDSGIVSPEIVTAFRKIRELQNNILQLQGSAIKMAVRRLAIHK